MRSCTHINCHFMRSDHEMQVAKAKGTGQQNLVIYLPWVGESETKSET